MPAVQALNVVEDIFVDVFSHERTLRRSDGTSRKSSKDFSCDTTQSRSRHYACWSKFAA